MNDIRFEATGSFDLVSVDQTGSGDIRLEAAGSLTVLASGAGVSTDGGTVFFTTGGSLFLNHDVTTEGGSLFAFVDGQITSSAGTSVNTSPSAGGTNSGSVSLFAQGAVDLSGDINTSGAGPAIDREMHSFLRRAMPWWSTILMRRKAPVRHLAASRSTLWVILP